MPQHLFPIISRTAGPFYLDPETLRSEERKDEERHEELRDKKKDFKYDFRRHERQAIAGADIGAATYITRQDNREVSPGNSTLGCWLKVKTKGDNNWKTVALTCYYSIRPAI